MRLSARLRTSPHAESSPASARTTLVPLSNIRLAIQYIVFIQNRTDLTVWAHLGSMKAVLVDLKNDGL